MANIQTLQPGERDIFKIVAVIRQLIARFSGAREVLTANRTYYVATTGADTNNGLASGSAFLTIQKAIDVACNSIDAGPYDVTIQVATGTYTGQVKLRSYLGSGTFSLLGDTSTPANVIINPTSPAQGASILGFNVGLWVFGGFDVRCTTAGALFWLRGATILRINHPIICGATPSANVQFQLEDNGHVNCYSNYSITSGAFAHYFATNVAAFTIHASVTCTVTGTPAFDRFAWAVDAGFLAMVGMTFSGSATGTRFVVASGGMIDTGEGAGGANFFPGNAAGTGTTPDVSPFGLYIG